MTRKRHLLRLQHAFALAVVLSPAAFGQVPAETTSAPPTVTGSPAIGQLRRIDPIVPPVRGAAPKPPTGAAVPRSTRVAPIVCRTGERVVPGTTTCRKLRPPVRTKRRAVTKKSTATKPLKRKPR
jgi:hypothetical protein